MGEILRNVDAGVVLFIRPYKRKKSAGSPLNCLRSFFG